MSVMGVGTQRSNHGGMMTVKLRLDQTCVRHDCLAPAREEGGFCTRCWLAMTPAERDIVRWAAEQPTEPIDTPTLIDALDCTGLEAALLLEWSDDLRPAA